MKTGKGLKIASIILIIILICLISFAGIYVKDKNEMKNIVKDYLFSMDFKGNRQIILTPKTGTEKHVYDKDGNLVEDADENTEATEENGYRIEEVAINGEDKLTEENYNLAKEIIEKRLAESNIIEYRIRVNRANGEIVLELPENDNTDEIISNISLAGKFEIQDSETKEVLMDNSYLKDSSVVSSTGQTGKTVALNIKFNKEGTKKLEELSKTYIETTGEDGNTTKKQVKLVLDGEEILTTHFSETITDGNLNLTIGSSSTDASDLQTYIKQARNMASILGSGTIPIQYEITSNEFLQSNISNFEIGYAISGLIVVLTCMMLYLILRFKEEGILAAILEVGFVALLLLVVRYTNVEIALEGMTAIVLAAIFNHAFMIAILNRMKANKEGNKLETAEKGITKELIQFCFIGIPAAMISIVFCFSKWLSVSSFGMTIFWAILLFILYQIVFTKNMYQIFKQDSEPKEEV